ncbi:MAG: undecaprenyldiphospho-muramoylpentapeptide beta-N-acetylglucosaminyltransferase [Deltaproteobacteria bacterium]|nr:MAG: undecaprenyldiphospho-muramoylpentapeptide beta-N-acetylglucosaminyltransferase [Deltaproteobacteria bacterium]
MKGKVIIAGGGTGGHLFPGIALAEEFTQKKEGWEVVFIGTERKLERKILSKWGFEFRTVPSAPLKGTGWWGKTAGLVTLLWGISWSIGLLRKISPQLVIGLGGYSSGPVLLAAYILGIKRVIQEQNVHPGFANRVASKFSQRVFLSWAEGAQFFPSEKVRVTGNPLRREVLTGRGEKRENMGFSLLILGGSQGASTINRAMTEALRFLEEKRGHLRIIHQTGEGDQLWVKREYEGRGLKASVHPFIDEMADCYRNAHLVVCRAGATTLAEICAWGRACLLIPYPYATDDHQRKNAQVLVKEGAGRMIQEEDLAGERLAQEILALYHSRRELEEIERRAAALGRPEAAALIVDECYQLLGLS